MVKMIALSRFFLSEGRQLRVGEEFETTEENAADLIAVQRAVPAKVTIIDKVAEVAKPYRRNQTRSNH